MRHADKSEKRVPPISRAGMLTVPDDNRILYYGRDREALRFLSISQRCCSRPAPPR